MRTLLFIIMVLFHFSNSYTQDCNITSKANDMIPNKLCAPVTVSWEVTYRGVNDGGTPVEIAFDWDDGNPMQIVPAINTNPVLKEWKATVIHVYPNGGPLCNYRPEAILRVNGVLCTSSIQQQNVTVWDTDNFNGGQLRINPVVYHICVGNSATVIFQDNSLWNCVPPVENDNPNNITRWTQWIYGTSYTISGVLVNGVAHAYPYYGPIVPAYGPVYGPQPPNNVSLPIFVPNTATVGQFFEVTLRNWNVCNPYDDPNIPGPPADPLNGDNPPIITTALILIVPYPDITIQPAGPFCTNSAAVNLSATPAGGTWSGPGITNSTLGTFNPATAGAGTHTITYSVTNAYGCTGIKTTQITVYARPNINMQPGTNLTVCPGDTLYLNANPTPGGGAIASHLWTGATTYLNATNIPNPYFVCNIPGIYNLTYRVTDVNGCWRQQNVTIRVANVSANILPDPAQACVGVPLQLNGNPSGGTGNYTLHLWTGADSLLSATNIRNPIFLSNVPGNFTLQYYVQDNLGCSGTDQIVVQVSATPIANAGTDDSICGLAYTLNAIPSIGSGSWAFVSGPGTVNFQHVNNPNSIVTVSQYGTYYFRWQEVYGFSCTSQDTVRITFIRKPTANAGQDKSLCGLQTNLQAIPSVGSGTWTFLSGPGNATIYSPNLPITNVEVDTYGSYQFIWKETNTNICNDADTVTVNFDVVPIASFLPTNPSGCSPFVVHFQNTSQYGVSYQWKFSDNTQSSEENPIHTFYNTTSNNVVYTVKLITTSQYGCKDSIQHSLTVHPLPVSQFTHNAQPACSPLVAQFNNSSIGAVQYLWNFGDGNQSNLLNPTHTFVNNTHLIQYFTVQLIATNIYNCIDTSIQYITVFPDPVYSITASPNEACSPILITFQTQPGAQQYLWDFGNGVVQQGGAIIQYQYAHNLTTPQNYNVQLIATNFFGCKDTAYIPVIINPKPAANFNIQSVETCSPATFSFQNLSQNANFVRWYWGDGSYEDNTNQIIQHTFINNSSTPQIFNVSMVVSNEYGCKDSISLPLTVNPNVQAQFTSLQNGCTPLTIAFQNQSTTNVSYEWNFGDGNTSNQANPTHVYTNQTNNQQQYHVSLVASSIYGCKDTAYATITVYPKPNANFSINTTEQCSPAIFHFNNLAQNANHIRWYWGDGTFTDNTANNIQNIYYNNSNNSQTFVVSLVATNTFGCKDSISQAIIVYPKVEAQFSSVQSGCSPLTVLFNNQSTSNVTYEWNFGNGTTSQQQNPTTVYTNSNSSPQTFNVNLIITSVNGCKDTASSAIVVYPSPNANLTVNQANGCAPLTVQFHNQSSGGNSFFYNFGDNTNSNSTNAIVPHTYDNITNTPVNYTCWLIVQNNYGCKDSTNQVVTVYPRVIASFTCDTAGCSPLNITFNNYSMYANTYLWNFGNGNTSNLFQPNQTFTNSSNSTIIFSVTLTATSTYGCTSTYQRNIYVYAVPNVSFNLDSTVLHYPNTTVLIDNTTPGTWQYLWKFSDGTTASVNEPVSHTFPTYGSYTITLIAYSSYCKDSVSQTIHIIPPKPIASYIPTSFSGCLPLTVTFQNQSQYAHTYLWDFGDGNSSNEINPTYTYSTAGNYTVTLVAIGPGGQDSYNAGQVQVYLNATAYFTVSPSVVFIPSQPIQCFNLSQNATTFLWNFGDGNTSTETNPKHYYKQEGEYTIQLIANNTFQCPDTFTLYRAVVAKSEGKIEFPSAFTPNPNGPNGGYYNPNDYNNDVFHPVFVGVEKYKLSIFNRWGELIFESEDPNIGWDGYYRGVLCKQDVYVWKVSGKFVNGESFFKAGDVTLLR